MSLFAKPARDQSVAAAPPARRCCSRADFAEATGNQRRAHG
jgi:hypothetical protein